MSAAKPLDVDGDAVNFKGDVMKGIKRAVGATVRSLGDKAASAGSRQSEAKSDSSRTIGRVMKDVATRAMRPARRGAR